MTTLQWSEELELGLAYMDETHREFVDLLASAAAATDVQLLAVWQDVVAHTEDHFGREDKWMQDSAFPPGDCHTTEHNAILQVMREGARRGAAGNLSMVRQLARELGVWFAGHAQSMDNALALYLKEVQYDEATGHVGKPYVHPAEMGSNAPSCGEPMSDADMQAAIQAGIRAAESAAA
jgi:hemerythrin-like metal-binding protein